MIGIGTPLAQECRTFHRSSKFRDNSVAENYPTLFMLLFSSIGLLLTHLRIILRVL